MVRVFRGWENCFALTGLGRFVGRELFPGLPPGYHTTGFQPLVLVRLLFEKPDGCVTVFAMSKTLQVKVASETLRARLSASASDNFRTVDQEALVRLERSFEIEDALVSPTHQKWVDEALSGEMRPGSVKRLRTIARKARALAE